MARITKAKQLTERDMGILTDMARCRVLSSSQIKNAYWPEAKERTCLERMERLQKAGYIKELTIYAEKAGQWIKVYCLDEKGKKWAIGPEGPGIDRRNVFTRPDKFSEVVHQIRTNEVYFSLSKTEKESWIIGDVLERDFKTWEKNSPKVPDAMFTNDSGEEVYVEADCGSYTAKQVRDKAFSFGNKKTIWVCPVGRKNFLYKHGARGEFFTYSTAGQGRVG